MPEYLDVIDRRNRVVGKELRRKCYEEGLLHRAVHVVILNSKGQILLQKRSKGKITYPGWWTSSATGHVDSGESYGKAAMREMQEEIGVRPRLRKLGDLSVEEKYNGVTDREILRVFIGRHDGPFRPDRKEVSEVKFFGLSELERMIGSKKGKFTPNLLKVIRMLRGYKS